MRPKNFAAESLFMIISSGTAMTLLTRLMDQTGNTGFLAPFASGATIGLTMAGITYIVLRRLQRRQRE